MIPLISALVEDNSGGTSSTRVVMLLWLTLVCIAWAFVAYKTTGIPDIPPGVLTLSGMLLSAKVVQRFGEKPTG